MTVSEYIKILQKYEFDKKGNANTVLFRANDGYEGISLVENVTISELENGLVESGDIWIKR